MRGGNISTPIENLVIEAQKLAKNGVKELILIAQDLTYYGLDLYKKRALGDLLKNW
jgi:ribosomal protein S12 methylthiotransferase